MGRKTTARKNANLTRSDSSPGSDSAAVEILPYLYLGPRSAAASESFIRSHGITHILSIGASPPTGARFEGVSYTRVSMVDSPSAGLESVLERVRGVIDSVRLSWSSEEEETQTEFNNVNVSGGSLPNNTKAKQKLLQQKDNSRKKILVHCSAAVSRSPSIVAAYLMSSSPYNMTLRQSLGRIIRARPAVNPNPGLFLQLKELEVRIRSCGSMDEVESLPGRREERIRLFEESGGERLKQIEEEGPLITFKARIQIAAFLQGLTVGNPQGKKEAQTSG